MADAPRPPDAVPGESAPAHAAWVAYRDMGAARSLAKVGQALGKSTALMERWSKRWSWSERAARHDGYLDGQRAQHEARALEQVTTDWVREREAQRHRELELGQALITKAREMLAWPLAQRRLDRDGATTIVEPTRWRIADAAKLVEVGAKLVRLSAEMETDRVTVRVEAERLAAELGIPVEEALAEVEAILAARGGKP